MEKYGIHNVRGGSFCQMVLTNSNIETLKQIITHKTDACFLCGNTGHYASNCNKKPSDPVIEKASDPSINPNNKCTCIMSFKFPHRKKKCAYNNFFN